MEDLIKKLHKDRRNLSRNIDKYLIPQELEKKKNAEVSTAYPLRQEMLNDFTKYGDAEFWNSPRKVFEPCAGKGGFLIDIVDRFLEGGLDYRVIVEECLYFADINPTNIFICRLLLDPYNEYKLNYYCGDTLQLDIKKQWGLDGFDAVIGNPPYNKPKLEALKGGYGGRSLWDKFVVYAIDTWLNKNGYLLFIHPPSWRKPEHYLWNKMSKENQILYLKMLTEKEGIWLFGCGVITDYYLLQKTPVYKKTIIYGQDTIIYEIDLSEWQFLPSGKIDLIKKILGTNEVIYNSSTYDSRRKWILPQGKKESKSDYYKRCKEEKYNYPIIHNMTKAYGNGYVFSNEDKGHFGVKKVILSHGRHQYPYNDYKGEYGMSSICFGLKIKNKKEGDLICKAIDSEEFKEILKYTKWSTFQTDWRMFKYFKKDFWKEFI